MEYLIIGGQLILSLSILVTLHELGHFAPARWFGMRVEKFYLFFDAWFSLWSMKKGETEYGIGWLPLGGYVKIAGMIDESMDKEQLKQEPQPWEFRSKPAWQRLIVMLGGVIVNFVLGFFIWGMMLWTWGDDYLLMENAKHGIATTPLAQEMGLKDGDIINKVGDKKFERLESSVLLKELLLNDKNTIEVTRNGAAVQLTIADSTIAKLASNKKPLINARFPFIADSVIAGGPAAKAGLQKGDELLSINNVEARYFHEFLREISKHKGQAVKIGILRNGQEQVLDLTTTEEGRISVGPKTPNDLFTVSHQNYSLVEALPLGVSKGVAFLKSQIQAFGQMFSGKISAKDSLGGFGSIAKLFSPTWDWHHFWRMTAILSLILGFMNLLPIPALDGGHAMFLLYEIVARRPASEKVQEYAQVVGLVLLVGLMLFANGMDVYRAWFQ